MSVSDPIFVTGGTGLLGNCIIRELLNRQVAVRALCRRGTPRTPFDDLLSHPAGFEIIEGDLDSVDVLDGAIAGCRGVIHSAAMIHIGWNQLSQSRHVNVAGTQHVVTACIKHRRRLVHVSTVDTLPAAIDLQHPISEAEAGGKPKTPCTYVISKTESEELVRANVAAGELDAVIIHPGFMLGPYDWKPSSGRMMLEVNKAPIVAAPPGGCSLCDARDVAAAIANAVDRGNRGENYILAGENLNYQDMWRHMLAVTGRQRRVFRLGPAIKWVGAVIDGFNQLPFISEGDVNGAAIAMGSLNHYYDSSKAERELDYVRRPIGHTLADAWEWLSQLKTHAAPKAPFKKTATSND